MAEPPGEAGAEEPSEDQRGSDPQKHPPWSATDHLSRADPGGASHRPMDRIWNP